MAADEIQGSTRQRKVDRLLAKPVFALTVVGGLVLLIEVLWVSWGVVARYALRSPDPYVTEATALFLMPLAFAGMAYALMEDAFPKVTMIVDQLSPKLRSVISIANSIIMMLIGLFFSVVSGTAVLRTIRSGAMSNIISWPEYIIWIPTFLFLLSFTIVAFINMVIKIIDHTNELYRRT